MPGPVRFSADIAWLRLQRRSGPLPKYVPSPPRPSSAAVSLNYSYSMENACSVNKPADTSSPTWLLNPVQGPHRLRLLTTPPLGEFDLLAFRNEYSTPPLSLLTHLGAARRGYRSRIRVGSPRRQRPRGPGKFDLLASPDARTLIELADTSRSIRARVLSSAVVWRHLQMAPAPGRLRFRPQLVPSSQRRGKNGTVEPGNGGGPSSTTPPTRRTYVAGVDHPVPQQPPPYVVASPARRQAARSRSGWRARCSSSRICGKLLLLPLRVGRSVGTGGPVNVVCGHTSVLAASP